MLACVKWANFSLVCPSDSSVCDVTQSSRDVSDQLLKALSPAASDVRQNICLCCFLWKIQAAVSWCSLTVSKSTSLITFAPRSAHHGCCTLTTASVRMLRQVCELLASFHHGTQYSRQSFTVGHLKLQQRAGEKWSRKTKWKQRGTSCLSRDNKHLESWYRPKDRKWFKLQRTKVFIVESVDDLFDESFSL